MDLAVLEGADVEGALCLLKDPVPVLEGLFESKGALAGLLGALGVGRDQDRDILELPAVAADVVEGLRASGRGYNARVEKVLREALARGKI